MICFVRKLNKPYRRIDFVIGGICGIIDGIVDIISCGYLRTEFRIWHTRRISKRGLRYLEKMY